MEAGGSGGDPCRGAKRRGASYPIEQHCRPGTTWASALRTTATAMSSDTVISLGRVSRAYNKKVVLDGINLSFLRGARIGVIGPNGSGKSSLLKVLAGVDTEFEG